MSLRTLHKRHKRQRAKKHRGSCVHFRQGIEWRTLTDDERRVHGSSGDGLSKWKYILMRDVTIRCHARIDPKDRYLCIDAGDYPLALIAPHSIRIKKGYVWNGSSMSPDRIGGKSFVLASLPHDVLFQFSGAPGFPEALTLGWCNNLFYALAPNPWGILYRAGLLLGSWACWRRSPLTGERVIKYTP